MSGQEVSSTGEGEDNDISKDEEQVGETTGDPSLEGDLLTWEFDEENGTLHIHGEGPMREYFTVLPSWEDEKDSIRKIVLDEGITSVGSYAFFDYQNLIEVYLPDSIEIIDESAFDFDTALQSIRIPASLQYVGRRAFYNTVIKDPCVLSSRKVVPISVTMHFILR